MDRKVVGVSGYLSGYLSIYLSVCLSVCLSICLFVYPSIRLSVYVSICLSVCLSAWLAVCQSVCLFVYPSIRLSVYVSIYLSICLPGWLAVCQSVCLSTYLSICLSICLSANWKMKLLCETSLKCGSWKLKTKFFSETSFNLEVDNIRNAAILQNLLQASKLSTSETKQFCETSFKNGKLSAELTPWYQCVLRFFHPISHKYCAATRKWGQVMGRSAAPVTQNHVRKPDDLMLQNATVLRKSALWSPNMPGSYASCTALATWHASVQTLFQRLTPAIVFETVAKPSHFAHSWHDAESIAPLHVFTILTSECALRHSGVHLFGISTSKSGARMVCFLHFGFDMCFAPRQRALLRHLNCQNWPENGVSSAFWLRHTSTCASRHNRVHFSNISTSKRAPNMWCFCHF